jgi:hypothetical protein
MGRERVTARGGNLAVGDGSGIRHQLPNNAHHPARHPYGGVQRTRREQMHTPPPPRCYCHPPPGPPPDHGDAENTSLGPTDQALDRAGPNSALSGLTRLAFLQAARGSLCDDAACTDNAAPSALAVKGALQQRQQLIPGPSVTADTAQLFAAVPPQQLAQPGMLWEAAPALPPGLGTLGSFAPPRAAPGTAAAAAQRQLLPQLQAAASEPLPAASSLLQLQTLAATGGLSGFASLPLSSTYAPAGLTGGSQQQQRRQQQQQQQPPPALQLQLLQQFGVSPDGTPQLHQWGGAGTLDIAQLFGPSAVRAALPQTLQAARQGSDGGAGADGAAAGANGGAAFKKTRRGCRGGRKKYFYALGHGGPMPAAGQQHTSAYGSLALMLPPPGPAGPRQL